MEYYVGLDVSLKQTSICVVDQTGSVVREGVVPELENKICQTRKSVDLWNTSSAHFSTTKHLGFVSKRPARVSSSLAIIYH